MTKKWLLLTGCLFLLVALIWSASQIACQTNQMPQASAMETMSPVEAETEDIPLPQETADYDDLGDEAMEVSLDEAEEEDIGEKVVNAALTRVGCPYVFGKKGDS